MTPKSLKSPQKQKSLLTLKSPSKNTLQTPTKMIHTPKTPKTLKLTSNTFYLSPITQTKEISDKIQLNYSLEINNFILKQAIQIHESNKKYTDDVKKEVFKSLYEKFPDLPKFKNTHNSIIRSLNKVASSINYIPEKLYKSLLLELKTKN